MRTRRLEPKARQMLRQRLYDAGEIETEEVMDMVRPYLNFNPNEAREKEVRRVAHQLMAGMRDEKGVRTTFACNIDGVSKYVNIDSSNDPIALRGVEGQLRMKLDGLYISKAKASKRRMEVEGQMSLDLTGSDEKKGMK